MSFESAPSSELQLPPPTPHVSHRSTLGYTAVELEEHRVHRMLVDDEYDPALSAQKYQDGQSEHELRIKPQIILARYTIKTLCENHAAVFETYMQDNAPSLLVAAKNAQPGVVGALQRVRPLERKRGPSYQDRTWAEWLSTGATDRELMNVLQWHVHSIDAQQLNPDIQAGVEQAKARYGESAHKGMRDGWLSAHAAEAIPRLDRLGVYFGDIFDTTFSDMSGYYTPGSNYIVIEQAKALKAPYYEKAALASIGENFGHEANHVLFSDYEEDSENPMAARWVQESFAEHVSQVFAHGSPDIIVPYKRNARGQASHVYNEERILLNAVVNKGWGSVKPSLATRAYSGNQQEQATFLAALDHSWGHTNVLGTVNRYVAELEDKLLDEGYEERAAQQRALVSARETLVFYPKDIFGASYRRPVFEGRQPAARVTQK